MSNEFIFVYGTLRKAFAIDMHQPLAQFCEFVSEGSMQGKLYEVEGYPGVVETNDLSDRVIGELYKIVERDALFSILDDYEMCSEHYPQPHEYLRKEIQVSTVNNQIIPAWVYIYNYSVAELQFIPSGDYLSFTSPSAGSN